MAGDAGPFRGHVRLQFPILTRPRASCALCVLPHMYTSAFFFFFNSLEPCFSAAVRKPDSDSESGFYLKADASLV